MELNFIFFIHGMKARDVGIHSTKTILKKKHLFFGVFGWRAHRNRYSTPFHPEQSPPVIQVSDPVRSPRAVGKSGYHDAKSV